MNDNLGEKITVEAMAGLRWPEVPSYFIIVITACALTSYGFPIVLRELGTSRWSPDSLSSVDSAEGVMSPSFRQDGEAVPRSAHRSVGCL
jgi:hypothetical protein